MKARRPPTAILLLFVTALAVWLTVRPRPPAPPRAGEAPPVRDAATLSTPLLPSTPATPAPIGTPADTTPTTAPNTPAASPVLVTANPPPGSTAAAAAMSSDTMSDAPSVNAIQVRRMVTDYHTLTGENPVGTNAEIMAALMGKNPRGAVLGPPEGFALNAQGELLDGWGTPYFFHQLSRDVMEIHSAGPDKIMGTADDIVVR